MIETRRSYFPTIADPDVTQVGGSWACNSRDDGLGDGWGPVSGGGERMNWGRGHVNDVWEDTLARANTTPVAAVTNAVAAVRRHAAAMALTAFAPGWESAPR